MMVVGYCDIRGRGHTEPESWRSRVNDLRLPGGSDPQHLIGSTSTIRSCYHAMVELSSRFKPKTLGRDLPQDAVAVDSLVAKCARGEVGHMLIWLDLFADVVL